MTSAADIAGVPLFQGEVLLSSWSETSKSGKTVTFALDIESATGEHPFKGLGTGKYGQKFLLVAVPVNDSGKPTSSPGSPKGAGSGTPASAAPPPPPKPQGDPGEQSKGGWYGLKPSARMAIMTQDKEFRAWVLLTYRVEVLDEEEADDWLKDKIDTPEKKLLNPEHEHHRPEALKAFERIEREYRIARGMETEVR